MDWIIGGTKDSREFIENILTKNLINDFLVSVTTEYGKKLLNNYDIKIIVQAMDIYQMKDFILKNNITRIFDFSHPYAKDVSLNAINISNQLKLKYFRFERENLLEDKTNKNYINFSNIDCLIEYISSLKENILITLGSNQIEKFTSLKNISNLYFRVLPTTISIEKLENIGILPKNIIGLQGPFSKDFNLAIYKNYNIKYLVTKESGNTGGELEKLSSANESNITSLILTRPMIKYPWVSNSIDDILKIYINI